MTGLLATPPLAHQHGSTHIQGRAASWDSSGGQNICRPGRSVCQPPGLRRDGWVREPQAANQGPDARIVPTCGLPLGASLAVLELRVQLGPAQPARPAALVDAST